MDALINIDVQNDFCPGGAMHTSHGNKVVPVINGIMSKFNMVIASRDWHPPESKHFKKWPKHCVQGSSGSGFSPIINVLKIEKIFLKDISGEDDGYSAFEATNADLSEYLKDNGIDSLFICGLTTEYCIKETATDSIKNGFHTFVLEDAISAVKPGSLCEFRAIEEMKSLGVSMVHFANLQRVDV